MPAKHTPDSSRYWFLESYRRRFEAGERPQSFDKDFVRSWVAAGWKSMAPSVGWPIRSPANACPVRKSVMSAVEIDPAMRKR